MGTKIFLPEHITTQLKCDLCRAYLSIPPISSYEDKFSCGRCNPGWPRNTIYEHLAQYMLFPCTYCEERLPWADVPGHEAKCRRNIVLCPAAYEKNYKLSKMPAANLGEYHRDCQRRRIRCPFDYCDARYDVREVAPHFDKHHAGYIFRSSSVSARKILKEEKVWNFTADNQVCLLMSKQTPFLLFVHSDCSYDEATGDILSYEYCFSVFSFCRLAGDAKYSASVALADDDGGEAAHARRNQEVKPFNDKLHLGNFLRIGLVKQNTFDFMTTRFAGLKRGRNLILTYAVKLLDAFEPPAAEEKRPPKPGPGRSFECPICKDYMCAPVYNCELGHSVCKNCKLKMAACPFCKAAIGSSRNYVFEDILETMQVACQNEGKGCLFTGRVQEVRFHELMCVFNP